MKKLILLTVTVILFSSCANLNGLQSRQYLHHNHSKGYVEVNKEGLHK